MGGHGHGSHHDEEKRLITEKMIVQDVLHVCPQSLEIFNKHLGATALKIPGAKTESIEFLCAMNDYHSGPLLVELNQVCKTAPHKVGHF